MGRGASQAHPVSAGWLAARVGVPEGQEARAARLLALVFTFSMATAIWKSSQSAIFLGAWSKGDLPLAFAASAVTLATASALSVPFATRLGSLGLARTALLGAAVVGAALTPLAMAGSPASAFAVYVGVEAAVGVLLIQVWAVVSEAVDPRSARRLMPLAGSGGSLAWLVGGALIGPLVGWVGAAGLLAVGSALLGACWALVWLIERRDVGPSPRRRGGGLLDEWRAGWVATGRSQLLRVSAALAVLALISEQLLDYQLLAAASARHDDADGIAAFMGWYYGLSSALSMGAQLLLAGPLFARLGAARAVALTPALTLPLALVAALVPGVGTTLLVRGGYRVTKQAIWASAVQQVLVPLPAALRNQGRTLTRGVLAPAAYGAFALGLAALPEAAQLRWVPWLSVGVLGLTLGVAAVAVRPAYLRALQRAIDRSRLDLAGAAGRGPAVVDPEAVAALASEAGHAAPDRAALAIELLGPVPGQAAARAIQLGLEHPAPEVRVAALDALAARGEAEHAAAVADRLADPDREVRRAAALALRKLRPPEPAKLRVDLDPHTDDHDADVAAAVRVVGLADRSPAERADALLPMLSGSDAAERRAAATALTTRVLQDTHLQSALVRLLDDPDAATRAAALRGAARLAQPEVLPRVLACLDDGEVGAEAAEALPAWGPAGWEAALAWAPAASPLAAWQVCRVCADEPGAHALIDALLAHPAPEVRGRAIRGLISAIRAGDLDAWPFASLSGVLSRELSLTGRVTSLLAGIARDDGTPDWQVEPEYAFLAGEVERILVAARRRVLGLLVCAGRRELLPALEVAEQRPTRVADPKVAELLEMALDRGLAARLVPLFEPMSLAAAVDAVRRAQLLDESTFRDPLAAIVRSGDAHLRGCAMLCYGARYTERFPERAAEDAPLIPLFEKMRFLRSVSIFGELTGADLRSLARVVDELSIGAGEVVLHKGDHGDELFVVVDGEVVVRDGGTQLALLGPREVFGELGVLDPAPRAADVVATRATRLLRLRGPELAELMARRPQLQREVIVVLVRRLREANRRAATG